MNVSDSQSAISAAVTPVVMISANAILISAISAKHQSMSDRLRALTAEWRNEATPAARRDTIAAQLRLFDERLRWVTWSHIAEDSIGDAPANKPSGSERVSGPEHCR